jgi:hypothetical protein
MIIYPKKKKKKKERKKKNPGSHLMKEAQHHPYC